MCMIRLKNVHLLSKSIDPCHQYLHVCVVSQEFGNPVIIESSQQKLSPQGYQPSHTQTSLLSYTETSDNRNNLFVQIVAI